MIPEKSSGNPERGKVVHCLSLELKYAVVTLAGPRRDGDTRESLIARAARRAGISFRQAKSLYYGETRDPRASVVERVRAALAAHSSQSEANARAELAAIKDRIASLTAQLDAMDQDTASARLAEVFGPAADASRSDRTMD